MRRDRRAAVAAVLLVATLDVSAAQEAPSVSPCFTLTATHIAQLRKLPVRWNPIMESGMAVLDLAPITVGGSIAPRLASRWAPLVMSAARRDALDASFSIFVHVATMAPGTYALDASDVRDDDEGEARHPLPRRREFALTAEHLKLLSHANAGWWDSAGSLVIDPKRPFGDRSAFELDMAEILALPLTRDADDVPLLGEAEQRRMNALYEDLPFALRVLLKHGAIEPGTYCREGRGARMWVRANR